MGCCLSIPDAKPKTKSWTILLVYEHYFDFIKITFVSSKRALLTRANISLGFLGHYNGPNPKLLFCVLTKSKGLDLMKSK